MPYSFRLTVTLVFRLVVGVLIALLTETSPTRADTPSVAITTVGHARFTVITPQLIRMEYAPNGRFVDDASWFAVRRDALFSGATVAHDGSSLTIDTGPIQLVYRDDGQPFSAANLSANIKKGNELVSWKPHEPNVGNLGGTIRTLDRVTGAMPLDEGVLSRDGWYLLDDSKSDLFVGDWIQSRPDPKNLDWYLFGYGTDYRAAMRGMTAVGGAIPLPRKYTLGIWYSRYWRYSADEFKQIVQEYNQHQFPLDMLVMDMDWHLNQVPAGIKTPSNTRIDTWTGYTWDHALIADPTALLKWMHDQGLHVTLNEHPAAGVQPHEEMYADFMRAMNADPDSRATIPFDAGSKTYLDAFYKYTHLPRDKEGVDFWWLDWQQYEKTRSIPELDNLAALNFYGYQWTSASGQRGQSLSRWAGWGDHRYPIEFSGDANTDWPMLAFEVPFTSTAGNVGAFFWSHDIGGHMGGRNEESYTRWCQFGAMTTTIRSHSSRSATMDRRPWTYPKWAEDSMRQTFQLRSRLMPYLYSSMWQATHDSVPFTRAMYIDHPETEEAYHQSQEYQFGDNLLVAPIASAGTGASRMAWQNVWFPDGEWYDFFTGEKFTGPTHAIASADIDSFPLYVRGGTPLPMQPYTPRPGTAALNTLVLRCYPGQDKSVGRSFLYEDDGVTTAYEHGASANTPLSYIREGNTVTVTVGATAGQYAGQPESRALIIELPCTESGATCDSTGAVCSYDAASSTSRIELPSASIRADRIITIKASEIAAEKVTATGVDAHMQQLLGEPYETWKAKNSSPDEATLEHINAVRGIAILETNQHPYRLGNDVVSTFFHNHHSEAEPLTMTAGTQPARSITLSNGDVVSVGNPKDAGGLNRLHLAVPVTLSGFADGTVFMGHACTTLPPQDDLALNATATSSAGNAHAAIDGSTDGYPGDETHEWVANGIKTNAWLKLTWPQPTKIDHVYLYDRPNLDDHILAGRLEFSDGSAIEVGELPNNGILPAEFGFEAKNCTWLKFTVTKSDGRTRNVGLSEIAVSCTQPHP